MDNIILYMDLLNIELLDKLIFNFCDSNEIIVELDNLNNEERKYIHNKCKLLYVEHKSIDRDNKRVLLLKKTNKLDIYKCICNQRKNKNFYKSEICKSNNHKCSCTKALDLCKSTTHICLCKTSKSKIKVKCKAELHDCICKTGKSCKSNNHECICHLEKENNKIKCLGNKHKCSCYILLNNENNELIDVKIYNKCKSEIHDCFCNLIMNIELYDLLDKCKSNDHECVCSVLSYTYDDYNLLNKCKSGNHDCVCDTIIDLFEDSNLLDKCRTSDHRCVCRLISTVCETHGALDNCKSGSHKCVCEIIDDNHFVESCKSGIHKCICKFNINKCYLHPSAVDTSSNNICAICLEETHGQKYRILTCNHILHSECLSGWIKENDTCPLCRKVITRARSMPDILNTVSDSYSDSE